MRKRFLLAKVICAAALIGLPTFVSAQDGVFDSGSTGADGAYSPTVSEVFMVTKAEYNFTSVNIPSDVTVTFDSALDVNHPVVWLSQGDITIEGTVDLSGAQGHSSRAGMRPAAEGGPGGWNGGPGATALIGDPDTTLQAIAGQGPGGAIPGDSSQRSGSGGGHRTDGAVGSSSNALTVGRAYGNAFGQPLLGGSGGAGATNGTIADRNGSGGGGGGGAFLGAASGDITISGSIIANGGAGGITDGFGDSAGGGGSGGTVRLVANEISISGAVSATGGEGGSGDGTGTGGDGSDGYIRLEAFSYALSGTAAPEVSTGVPIVAQFENLVPRLSIASVGGMDVTTLSGAVTNPDLDLSTSDPVTVVFDATNIPLGTELNVRVFPVTGIPFQVTSPGLTGSIESSTTSVDVTLPAGVSQIVATTTFSVSRGAKQEQVKVAASLK